jgi:hypothetical protein
MFAARMLVAAPGKEVPAGANQAIGRLDGLTSAFHGRGFSRDGAAFAEYVALSGTFAFTYNAFRGCFASEDARVGEAAIVASRTFPCASFASIK